MSRSIFFGTPPEMPAAAAPLYADLAVLRMRLALVRLARKQNFNPAQPRVPAGNAGGGQWTDAGGSSGRTRVAANDRGEGGIGTDAQTGNPKQNGTHVVLPNGKMVSNKYSTTGYLLSPVSDLNPVATAGRQAGAVYRQMLASPTSEAHEAALPQFFATIGASLGQGGRFDYQRSGNHLTGFLQHPEFRDVSNFNVGLYLQQTGQFSEENALALAGSFARKFSSNRSSNQPYGLDPRTASFIRAGYRAAASGQFGSPEN